jgi:hypothetical protein
MNDAKTRQILQEHYNFSLKDLIKLTGQLNPFQMSFPFTKRVRRWIKKILHIW